MPRKIVLALLTTILLIAGGVYWRHATKATRAMTTSKAPTAQNNYHSGSTRAVSGSTGASQGGAVDTQGKDATPSSSSQPVAGSSGIITLYSPSPNTVVKSGDIISGTAKVTQINYRLVDDVTGVIAQGQLDVVNGKYSGKLQFNAQGSTGKLDVFSFDPTTGAEVNNVEIQVQY